MKKYKARQEGTNARRNKFSAAKMTIRTSMLDVLALTTVLCVEKFVASQIILDVFHFGQTCRITCKSS